MEGKPCLIEVLNPVNMVGQRTLFFEEAKLLKGTRTLPPWLRDTVQRYRQEVGAAWQRVVRAMPEVDEGEDGEDEGFGPISDALRPVVEAMRTGDVAVLTQHMWGFQRLSGLSDEQLATGCVMAFHLVKFLDPGNVKAPVDYGLVARTMREANPVEFDRLRDAVEARYRQGVVADVARNVATLLGWQYRTDLLPGCCHVTRNPEAHDPDYVIFHPDGTWWFQVGGLLGHEAQGHVDSSDHAAKAPMAQAVLVADAVRAAQAKACQGDREGR